MDILAVVDFGLNEKTGGYKRNFEIMKRLPKRVNIDIVPSIRNVRLYSFRKDLISLLKGLNSTPDYVIELLEKGSNVEEFLNGLKKKKYDVAVVYSNSSENVELARRITSAPIGVQLQLEPFYRDLTTLFKIKFRGVTGKAVRKFKEAMEESKKEELKWKGLIERGNLNFAISVSKVPLINSGLDRLLSYRVTKPGNAFDENMLKFRGDKEDYAVYFTRLMPEKGLFEIPLIWKKLRRDIRLYVMGQFVDESDKDDFLSLVKRLNVNVEYIGLKEEEELYSIVAKALFTVYPSHYDSFSLVVLESLALGTPVYAYDTLALREIFGNVKGVHLVREGDVKGLADLISSFKGEEVPIPEDYSSWDRVAEAELEDIKAFAKK
ncbi:glycosyltransferase family 1 protein [Saccharolobus solfataricus]|uniref:Glycosyltransferase n=3 Tax=Saccharolobus solfataricus TaxID=2287 RepID=Q97UU3_SACS2|nr:glycosyltransferase [Saccharolobus solfataricus]AAK43009.1 Glycosyltransferase [Saccharolobus solfataricus P2]AKA73074.1 glycosyltransferase family 1 protein [Saccharolobus solfataricus]AKA75772.1 glycosyltransferase family 1 protein [Saccharolobus solfataricus]AKA78464.1 glycosyltransferase family 1 protein [Saccharolobus solfataricus]AZF67580.1 glycosyltransferase family 1 protein [Saccharolobus solfataricus]